MKKIIVCLSLLIGAYVGFSGALLVGVALMPMTALQASEWPVSSLEVSTGQTRVFPDVRLQPALGVQGTVGVE